MTDNTEYRMPVASNVDVGDAAKRPCLIMIKGDFIGQVFELAKDVTVIGRSDDADLTSRTSAVPTARWSTKRWSRGRSC
jgi:hypothetical protein